MKYNEKLAQFEFTDKTREMRICKLVNDLWTVEGVIQTNDFYDVIKLERGYKTK